MISHTCFFGALLIFYVPKMLKVRSNLLRNAHILLGVLAILGMLGETMMTIGSPSFMKYLGFSMVMLFIGVTGYYLMKSKNGRMWHITATIAFFVYLLGIIIL